MQIETYEIEDASNEISQAANDHEAMELIEKLGLSGQTRLLNKETVTRVPYRIAEAEEIHVYRTLNPEQESLENYDLDPIPVRVLQVAAFAKSLNYFERLVIWYPKAGRVEDPLLVGIWKGKRADSQWTTEDFYILARWGKTLKPFAELKEQAIAALQEKARNALAKTKAEMQACELKLTGCRDLTMLTHGLNFYGP